MANDDNKIILEFPATNVEIELGETITFDNISGFLNSDRVTYDGESLTDEITHLENDKADSTYVDTELAKKADKTDTYTKAQVDDIVYGILPDDTASGSVANFETDLALPLKSLEVDVNAVQSAGTPTPATPLPISGRSEISLTKCGKNLLNLNDIELLENNRYGVTISKTGTFYISGSYNGEAFICARTKSGDTYGETKYIQIGGQNTATPISITVGDGETLLLYNASAKQTLDMTKAKLGGIQLEAGSSESTYEPYAGNTEVISLGGTYYGGYVTQDKDGKREIVVTHEIIDLGSFNWYYSTNDNWFQIAHAHKFPTNNNLCSCYPVVYSLVNFADKTIAIVTGYIAIKDTSFGSDENAFKTAMTGQKLVYELTTPITIPLTDGEPIITLIGTNNIYADTGDTEVVFKSSVNDYVSAHSGGGLLGMGGVYLGGAKSGGE